VVSITASCATTPCMHPTAGPFTFAFVGFADSSSALNAVQALDGMQLDGCRVRVELTRVGLAAAAAPAAPPQADPDAGRSSPTPTVAALSKEGL
jgi:RNA recognition motif-containing protein